ncbi:MAG TPA: phosphatase PAP2-related protein [Bacteroidia bacterium]|jgi:hypothetical protein
MVVAWRIYLSGSTGKKQCWLSIAFLIAVLFVFMLFLSYNETRTGYVFNDPALELLVPADHSSLIFLVTYGMSLMGLMFAVRQPEVFTLLLLSYAVMTVIRIFTLIILPLEAPAGIIPLEDIFLESSFYAGRVNLKDLFFSGHTAALFIFAFSFEKKILKWAFALSGMLVGLLLMSQHVHYSIDVIVAPLVSWLSVLLSSGILKR